MDMCRQGKSLVVIRKVQNCAFLFLCVEGREERGRRDSLAKLCVEGREERGRGDSLAKL